ncbi:MAG: 50S ribosomal protein L9 [Chloroflexi bacterium]|nr:MAG: 50S ribosomal protein L9 [Chloroflexota bacterium]
MKIILTENLPKLGEVGDICEVADGYARNYLLPQGLAIVATEGALKQVDNLKRQEARRRERVRDDAIAFKEVLEGLSLVFAAKVGETGRLYGSITSGDIADRIEEITGHEVDRRKIILDNPLKQLGTFQVPIRLLPEVTAQLTVVVEAEEEEELPESVREALEEEGILVATDEEEESSEEVEATEDESESPETIEPAEEDAE